MKREHEHNFKSDQRLFGVGRLGGGEAGAEGRKGEKKKEEGPPDQRKQL